MIPCVFGLHRGYNMQNWCSVLMQQSCKLINFTYFYTLAPFWEWAYKFYNMVRLVKEKGMSVASFHCLKRRENYTYAVTSETSCQVKKKKEKKKKMLKPMQIANYIGIKSIKNSEYWSTSLPLCYRSSVAVITYPRHHRFPAIIVATASASSLDWVRFTTYGWGRTLPS